MRGTHEHWGVVLELVPLAVGLRSSLQNSVLERSILLDQYIAKSLASCDCTISRCKFYQAFRRILLRLLLYFDCA